MKCYPLKNNSVLIGRYIAVNVLDYFILNFIKSLWKFIFFHYVKDVLPHFASWLAEPKVFTLAIYRKSLLTSDLGHCAYPQPQQGNLSTEFYLILSQCKLQDWNVTPVLSFRILLIIYYVLYRLSRFGYEKGMGGMRERDNKCDHEFSFLSLSYFFHLFITDGIFGDFLMWASRLWLSVLAISLVCRS